MLRRQITVKGNPEAVNRHLKRQDEPKTDPPARPVFVRGISDGTHNEGNMNVADALQLWAQVYWLVTEAEKEGKTKENCFRLTESEKKYLEKRNSAFTKPMKGEMEVLDVLAEQQIPEQNYTCTVKEMTVSAFIQHNNLRYDVRTIGRVLKKYGYIPVKKRVNGIVMQVIRLPYKYYCNSD